MRATKSDSVEDHHSVTSNTEHLQAYKIHKSDMMAYIESSIAAFTFLPIGKATVGLC